ncbi:hypothetical protein HIM_04387 [Hirsutella minnesotensis 3608]|uniref:Uncharacterized protein n=1 Tax=Hirsutella minnesotensis 3608 TaxID=1043627 RepID=A0A0F7ZPY4_9HYPO|nr:hypothetical protein HIM_04387 [Hirsutella minnesotensis 3608]
MKSFTFAAVCVTLFAATGFAAPSTTNYKLDAFKTAQGDPPLKHTNANPASLGGEGSSRCLGCAPMTPEDLAAEERSQDLAAQGGVQNHKGREAQTGSGVEPSGPSNPLPKQGDDLKPARKGEITFGK